LRGGSLLITIFGDAIAPRGGLATLGSLIRLAAPFGLTERLVRTSVGRLARDGWLVARRDGRRSEYRLTPQGQQSFAQATSRLYAPGPNEWNGQWTLLLLPSAGARRTRAANARDRLREELRWLGFGQLNPGVFLHPGCTPEEAQEWMLALPVQEEAVLLRSSGGAPAADRRLVEAGWDLAELARRYRLFVAAFRPARQALANATADTADRLKSPVAAGSESAFIIRTLLIHEYRKIHLQDPLLPPRLLPEHWIGASAYELCRSLYSGLFTAAEDYLSATASTLEAALPRAGREVLTRFGGIGENG
jgi:phenylacetic acid degradation operon negative regulatory protein